MVSIFFLHLNSFQNLSDTRKLQQNYMNTGITGDSNAQIGHLFNIRIDKDKNQASLSRRFLLFDYSSNEFNKFFQFYTEFGEFLP